VKVLIIEHDCALGEALAREVSALPRVDRIKCAASELAAEELLFHFSPDVIFLDMQLPEQGAFRIAARIWTQGMPSIICTTAFDRPLLDALNRHRVEYLIRPFGSDELAYMVTRTRRPDPVHPAENVRRILDAAASLNCAVTPRLSVRSKRGRLFVIDVDEIAAVRYDRGRLYFWTAGGIFESTQPAEEIWAYAGLSSFRRLFRNSLLRNGEEGRAEETRRARRWLQRCALADVLLKRPPMPSTVRIKADAVPSWSTK